MKTRSALASLMAVALAATAGIAVGLTLARGEEDSAPDAARHEIRLAGSSLQGAEDCASLLETYVDRGLDLVSAYGWEGEVVFQDGSGRADLSGALRASASTKVPSTVRSTSGDTGTNVQEVGVDEPDVVKVAGDRLFRIQDDVLTTHDVGGDEPELLSSLRLPDLHEGEILLSGQRVVVLGDARGRRGTSGARVLLVDVSRPGTPSVVEDATYAATISAARLHGDVVRVVLDNGLPELDFRFPDGDLGRRGALSFNEQLVRGTTLADWLPTVDGAPAVDCAAVSVPEMETALGTTTVLAFEPAAFEPVTSAVATTATTSYFSANRLYLATSPSQLGRWATMSRCLGCGHGTDDGSTQLFAFALDGTETTHAASGSVDGMVADRWSMDFAAGALRLAVGATSATGNFSSVVTIRETGATLSEVGRVDKLGVNEEIKSVRWFDDLAIVVTFRRVDPLHAIDLTDPEAPELMGELKIPGFSEYLHPLGARRLIGVGQTTTGRGMAMGAQAALFDVTDLTEPERLDVVKFPTGSTAGAGLDPRQFTWLPERRQALTVVSEGQVGRTGSVAVLSLDRGRMTSRLVEVEHGDDVAQVRLVPLADGRVVLVTGDAVSFFDL